MSKFGSEYNGVINAVTQFLGVIALFRAGLVGVSMVALYKPLADDNREEISIVVKTTAAFLKKVCLLFGAFAVVLSFVYPFLVEDSFNRLFTTALVLIMSIGTIAQYFFGESYRILLGADQRIGFVSAVNCVKTLLSTAVAVTLIELGFGIIEVQIGIAVVFVIAPIYINVYTRRKYRIIPNVKPDNSKLKQRWDNFAQAVANFICENTDLVVLSIASNVLEISVYSVYNLVMRGIFNAFQPFTISMGAAFGNMFVKEQVKQAENNLRLYEQFSFAIATFLLSTTAAMVVPFVMIYTKGVTDVEYSRVAFAYIFTAATLFKCYRTPYVSIVNAVGHFKQTRNAAIVEVVINIVVTLALVYRLGIVGVVIGTLCAYAYRTFMYAWYVSMNVIKRSILLMVKRVALSVVQVCVIAFIPYVVQLKPNNSYIYWVINAVFIALFALILVIGTELIFYRDDLRDLIKKIKSVSSRKNVE